MTTNELLADVCMRNLEMLKMSLADFSEADLYVRPCPGANHAAWQIGHCMVGEAKMVNGCAPGAIPELPGGAEKFSPATSKNDNPAAFGLTKAQLLAHFDKVRAATAQWAKTLSPEDLAKPVAGDMSKYCPTVGHLVLLLLQHVAMHLGQIQVIRRKLGKPVLF